MDERAPARILIVEDESIVAEDLRSRMRDLGYSVCGLAASGDDAVLMAERERPDLVLMDIHLRGEMDGLEAAWAIRNRFGIPSVFITGYADEAKLQAAKLTLPFGYIVKPFFKRDLRITVEMAIYAGRVEGERRLAEEALRESEARHREAHARLRSLLENTDDGMVLRDEQGFPLIFNSAFAEMVVKAFGVEMRPGLKPHTLFEDKVEVERWDNYHKRALGGEKFRIEFSHDFGEWGVRYYECSFHPAVEEGRVVGFSEVSRNITERKNAEERLRRSEEWYRLIWENAIEGIAVLQDGNIVFGNPHAGLDIGYTLEEIIGANFIDFVHPEDREIASERYRGRIAGKKQLPTYPLRMITKSGGQKWLLVGGVRVDWEGRPADLLFISDIHEQVMAAEAIKRANEELDEKVRQRTRELESTNARLDREINERMRTEEKLRSHQERLRQMTSEHALIEERERRQLAIELHDQIGQYLAMANLKLRQFMAENDRGDPSGALGGVIELLGKVTRDTRSLTLELSPPILYELGLGSALEWLAEDLQEKYGLKIFYIEEDDVRAADEDISVILFRTVRELLLNAIKHAEASRANVTASVEGEQVIIEVEDDGVGFDPRTSNETGGFGETFGLFSIRERLNSFGGRFELETGPGRGTRVKVSAPFEGRGRIKNDE